MILEKFEDLSFCHHITEDGQSIVSGRIRRLSIATSSNDLMASIESSHIRSLLVFTNYVLPEYFVRRITIKYRRLKVLDFKDAQLLNVPKNLGCLIHLKYLSFRCAQLCELPKSIGMLQNLETLDIRGTIVREMPKEINKLRKLRHLLGNKMSLIQLKNGIGGMTSLQTLSKVDLAVDGVVELIRELGKLKQLRELGLDGVGGEHGGALSSLISEMQHLHILYIESKLPVNGVDLHLISAPPLLQNLTLYMKVGKLPKWIPELRNLVQLKLGFSHLTDDPMKSLQNMQNLLSLYICYNAYEGESFHFQDGGFEKLKELCLWCLKNLNSMVIDKEALHSLKKLGLFNIPQLKMVPTGIQHLKKLEVLTIDSVPTEFVLSISPNEGKEHWIIEHVPLVDIY